MTHKPHDLWCFFSGNEGYLSRLWISSTVPPWFRDATCFSSSPDCLASAFPLEWLPRWDASSALALAGHGGGFSAGSGRLLPLACLFMPGAPLPLLWMVVLLRRLAGPLISALSLMSAAPLTQKSWIFFFLIRGRGIRISFSTCHTLLAVWCSRPEPYKQSGGGLLPSSPTASVFVAIRRFITTTEGASDRKGLPRPCSIFTSPNRARKWSSGWTGSLVSIRFGAHWAATLADFRLEWQL